jgi:hypothetical protein
MTASSVTGGSRRSARGAAEKGNVRPLLDEKWRKVYHANAPRDLFTKTELRAA